MGEITKFLSTKIDCLSQNKHEFYVQSTLCIAPIWGLVEKKQEEMRTKSHPCLSMFSRMIFSVG